MPERVFSSVFERGGARMRRSGREEYLTGVNDYRTSGRHPIAGGSEAPMVSLKPFVEDKPAS